MIRQENSPKTLVRLATVLLLMVVLCVVIYLYLRNPRETQAAWFDDSYGYRQKITFTHNTTLTNRKVGISVDTVSLITAGKMQADCDDIRFTDLNGKLLRYQIFGTCNNTATIYHVLFPTIHHGTNVAYIYYGNPSATTQTENLFAFPSLSPSGGSPVTAEEEKGTTPILYWNFNDIKGTTVQDSTQYNNDGTVVNAVWRTADLCVFESCLYFNGTGYVAKSYSSDSEMNPGIDGMTISAWVKQTGTISGTATIISRYATAGYKLYMNNSGNICFGIDSDATWSPADSACSTKAYNDSRWHYVAATKTESTTVESVGTAVKIHDPSNFGSLHYRGKQVIRTENGYLYAILRNGTYLEVWRSTDNGATWTEQDGANSPTGLYIGGVKAALDGNGVIHIAFNSQGDHGFHTNVPELAYTTFNTASNTFGATTDITWTQSASDGLSIYDIAIDSNNAPHILYSVFIDQTETNSLNYINKTSGVWQTERLIASHHTLSGAIVINEDNIPEIAYIRGHPTYPYLYAGLGNGNNATSFTTVIIDYSVPLITGQGASLAVDSQGNTWVAYIDENGAIDYVTLIKHNDLDAWSTWQAPVNNSNAGRYPSIAVNGGNIYVLYVNSSDDIAYNRYNGSTWLGETTLDTGTFYNPIVKYSYYYNHRGNFFLDYLYDDNTDVYYNVLTLETGSGTPVIQLYVDGKKEAEDTSISATGSLSGVAPTFYVGIDSDGSSNPWRGYIDEVKVYNYAKTAAQIQTSYISRGSLDDVSVSIGASEPTESVANGLIAWWKMDETTGNAQDSSGNGYTLTNNNTTPFTGGKFANSAGPFDGTNRYFSTATTIPNIHTVALWVYPTSTTNHYFNLASGIYLTSSAGTLTAVGFTNPTIYVNGIPHTTIAANRWQHITVTTTSPITANNVEIGRANNAYFQNNGFIDEVRFYNRTLTAPEVEKLYDWGPPPVAYWKLDENTGTTAADNSGNGNTSSTFTGNTTWTGGKYGSGLLFDGDNDVVRIPESSSTDIGATTDSYTISAFIKTAHDGTSSAGIVVKDDGSGAYPFSIYLNSAEQACFRISDGTNSPVACSTTALNDNRWHYITAIRDVATDTISIYVDGTALVWSTDTTTGSTANNDDISIGNGEASYISADFTGVIDEAKIYNYARTQKQIIEDMNAGHPVVGTPVGGAVGHWSLDEATGTTANDKSGNANNLTLSTDSWTLNGKWGSAFNGTGANWLFRADDDDFDFIDSESFTLSGWFRSDSPTNPPTDEYILSKENTSGGYALWFNTNGEVICGIDDDATSFPEDAVGDIPQNPDYYDGTWHHYACVRDTAAGRLTLYIDGKIVDTKTSLSATGSLANADTLTFGSRNTTDDTDDFNGDLDELKIYRAALSASEILIDMNQGKTAILGATSTQSNGTTTSDATNRQYCLPGDTTTCAPPVGHWSFDENTGTSAFDRSANNHTGTLQNGPVWTTGKIGSAIDFDGANDRVDVASTSTIDDLEELSITAWIYPRSFGEGNFGRIINKDHGSNTQLLFNMLNNTGQNSFRFYRGRSDIHTFLDAANNSITRNRWQHVAVVFSTSQSIGRLYVNGQEVAYALQQIGSGTLNSEAGTELNIGGRSFGTNRAFDGILDDIRLYNYVRTQAQINWDYNRGAPLAHYKMDECATTTLYNAALNANGQAAGINGTWSGTGGTNIAAGTCTTPDTTTARYNGRNGKFGSSLDFDAADDVITITNTSEIDLNEGLRNGFTIAAWIYPDSDGEGHAGRIFDKGTNTYCRLGGETGGRANVICRLDLTTDAEYTATTTIPIGQWSHIALAWTNDSDDEITIWVNGTPNTSVGMFAGDPAPDTSNLFIGNNSAGSATFDGRIDDVRIYTYELTGTLIRNLMNEGSAVRFGPITGSP